MALSSADQTRAAPVPAAHPKAESQLLAAYTELTNLLLQHPDVVSFLQQVAELAAMVVVPPASCGITLRRGTEVSTVASTGALASVADELQYGAGAGPCLQAMRDARAVHVPDLTAEHRWDGYRAHALTQGVRSSLSLPLVVDGTGIGALNLYSTSAHHFTAVEITQSTAFAAQASTLLSVVLAQARATEISDQLQETLLTRAVIDQALGLVMGQQRCTAAEAFEALRRRSQQSNVKLAAVAAELITTATGHQPQPPRPFISRTGPQSPTARPT